MPWLFQKTVARKSRSAVCSNLQALHDAECKELLRQTKEYEALRFLQDGKNQGSKSCVSILPKQANNPVSSSKLSITVPWCRIA